MEMTNYHITGTVTHNNGTTIVQASTREFCIARHLYKTTDISASHNVGRVLAQRCLETGVNRVMWEDDRTIKNNPKVLNKQLKGSRDQSLHTSLPNEIL